MRLIELKGISLAFGGHPLLNGVDLGIDKAERVCLLGRNGEGKTSLLRLIAAQQAPDAGEILRGSGLRTALLPQELPAHLLGSSREVVAGAFAFPPGEDAGLAIERALTRAGLDPDDEFATLSTGTKRRILLAGAMASDPDLLLLDEPTNHLDIDAIATLEAELLRRQKALLFVTHDRAFLRALATRIVELDRGSLHDYPGDYEAFLRRRDAALEAEAIRNDKFDKKLAGEEAWLRQGVRARRTRNEGRVRELMRLREERQARRAVSGQAQFQLQSAERSGRQVIGVRDLSFAWGDKVIVRDFSTRILRGDKVAILGPNGSGKTTLLRLLIGELTPDAGTITQGSNLSIAYFDQQREQLDESRTVQDNITDGAEFVVLDGRSIHALSYLKQFLFSPERARAPLSHLSGGERNRLLLARLFTRPANFLVLDEPTNDLDLETVELLEDLIVTFRGTLLLVSHDREFLDNVTTSTLVLAGEGRIDETVGGYSDWARTRRSVGPGPKPAKTQRRKSRAEGPPKLTWKEKQELAALPGEIEALESEQDALHAKLTDPALYQRAGGEVAAVKLRLESLAAELTAHYDRWQTLSEREDV